MVTLFVLLLLASIICLVIGLIKPKIFSRIFKKYATRKKLSLIFGGAIVLFFILIGATAPKTNKNQIPPTPTATQPTPTQEATTEPPKAEETETKEIKILQEQKVKAENLTKTAVNLITEDKMSEAIALYNARWNELAKLRVEIIYDKELTDTQKKNIDNALKVEQESITSILSKYEQLYR